MAEVIGTIFMKYSEGFTRLWPSVGTAISYCAAFYLLSQTLENIPTGIAYAIWSGAGIVLISLAGWLVSGQNLIGPQLQECSLFALEFWLLIFFKIFCALTFTEAYWPKQKDFLEILSFCA